MDLFNTREVATAVWLGALLVFGLSKRSVRKAALGVIRAFFHWKILAMISFMALYTAGVVWALHATGAWTAALLKDTVLWFTFSGAVLAFSVVTTRERDEKAELAKSLKDNVRVVVVLEFLVATYTFSLPVELLLIPAITILAMMNVVATSSDEYSAVAKLTMRLQVLVGAGILVVAVVKAIADFRSLQSADSVRQVVLPVALSLLFVPCIYTVLLVTRYESLFLRLRMGSEKSRAVQRYAKRRLFRHLGPSVGKVGSFVGEHAFELMRLSSKEDVDELLGGNGSEPNCR